MKWAELTDEQRKAAERGRARMVRVDGSNARAQASAFLRALIPETIPAALCVAVEGASQALAYLPGLGQYVDLAQESLVAAILGDGPSAHWGAGDEPQAPIDERLAFEAMPEFDHPPARF